MRFSWLFVVLALIFAACGDGSDECDDAACAPSTEQQLSPVAATLTAAVKSIRDGTPLATVTSEPAAATPSAEAQPPGSGESGITGVVLIGPQCPVVREGEECPDAPYEAFIGIRDAAGQAIASVASGADGRFRVELPPGTYTLVARPQTSTPIPGPVEMTVTVEAAEFTEIVVSMDSGIR
jgi:hypothetical protein